MFPEMGVPMGTPKSSILVGWISPPKKASILGTPVFRLTPHIIYAVMNLPYLVGGLEHFLFSIIYRIILPID